MIGWVLVNVALAKKYFCWRGVQERSTAEIQEAIALALINNQWISEWSHNTDCSDDGHEPNDSEDCTQHPLYNSNICRYCRKRKTVYYCRKCSAPKPPKLRRDKGRVNGGIKRQRGGYMHFCKGDCFKNRER